MIEKCWQRTWFILKKARFGFVSRPARTRARAFTSWSQLRKWTKFLRTKKREFKRGSRPNRSTESFRGLHGEFVEVCCVVMCTLQLPLLRDAGTLTSRFCWTRRSLTSDATCWSQTRYPTSSSTTKATFDSPCMTTTLTPTTSLRTWPIR